MVVVRLFILHPGSYWIYNFGLVGRRILQREPETLRGPDGNGLRVVCRFCSSSSYDRTGVSLERVLSHLFVRSAKPAEASETMSRSLWTTVLTRNNKNMNPVSGAKFMNRDPNRPSLLQFWLEFPSILLPLQLLPPNKPCPSSRAWQPTHTP